ncbi:hypothetical protein ABCR94_34755 [Streptomyces sp. 21So2-11]|uniref:hypothetical protein n=1 Tax=Streptomyces sp. 21So2-11 TaxID=3144408 RepID=UPI00321A7EF5
MLGRSLSKASTGWTRATVALGLAVAAVSLSAGAAAASSPEPPTPQSQHLSHSAPSHIPPQAVESFCRGWEAVAAELPLPTAAVQVCKLVNGWQ